MAPRESRIETGMRPAPLKAESAARLLQSLQPATSAAPIRRAASAPATLSSTPAPAPQPVASMLGVSPALQASLLAAAAKTGQPLVPEQPAPPAQEPAPAKKDAAPVAEEKEPDVEEDALLNCDLCILAYQLYHQSVMWPLDPWYEMLARGGTSRRDHYMRRVHDFAKTLPGRPAELYAGPAAVGGLGSSHEKLDPILSNYGQIRPREPALTGDGAIFMALRAPAYITDRIKKASVASYTGPWQENWPHGPVQIREIVDEGTGDDELIAFEGGTGSVDGKEAAWSLMGYALKRTRADGGWDAHIAFRGSRSGNAVRAAIQGLDKEGNADWVTDMASTLVSDPYYGGSVAKGFGAALKRCMGTLRAALLKLHAAYGAPKSIQITGHSLGAALASLCASSFLQGTPGAQLRTELPGWKFSKLRGYFNALPPAGAEAYAANFLKLAGDRAYAPYVAGDIVVENSRSVALKDQGVVGFAAQQMGSGGCSLGRLDRMPRPSGATGLDNSHEMTLIRAGLVDKRIAQGKPVTAEAKNATPWGYFLTFMDLLDGKPVNYVRGDKPAIVTRDNLRKVLANYRFSRHFRAFLGMMEHAVGDPRCYRGFHREASYAQAAERFQLAAQLASGPIEADDVATIVDTVGTQAATLFGFEVKTEVVRKGWKLVKQAAADGNGIALDADDLVGEDFTARIGLGLVLAALEEKPQVSVDDFAKVPELALCLEAVLGDASKKQKKAAEQGGRAA